MSELEIGDIVVFEPGVPLTQGSGRFVGVIVKVTEYKTKYTYAAKWWREGRLYASGSGGFYSFYPSKNYTKIGHINSLLSDDPVVTLWVE